MTNENAPQDHTTQVWAVTAEGPGFTDKHAWTTHITLGVANTLTEAKAIAQDSVRTALGPGNDEALVWLGDHDGLSVASLDETTFRITGHPLPEPLPQNDVEVFQQVVNRLNHLARGPNDAVANAVIGIWEGMSWEDLQVALGILD